VNVHNGPITQTENRRGIKGLKTMTRQHILLLLISLCIQHLDCGYVQGSLLKSRYKRQQENDCRTDDGMSGKCVRLSDCNPRPSAISVCMAGIRGVCCPTATVSPQSTDTRTSGDNRCTTPDGTSGSCTRLTECNPRPTNPTVCIGNRRGICCPSSEPVSECGMDMLQLTQIKGLILGGDDAEKGTWPWMIALFGTRGGVTRYHCGGAIIHRQYVLTAAHCFDHGRKPENFHIRVSGYDISVAAQDDVPGAEDAQIEQIIIHPQYNRGKFNFDLALVKLKRPVTRTDQRVCLPEGPGRNLEVKLAHLTGWGNTVEGVDGQEGKNSDILQEITLPVQDISGCRDVYASKLGQLLNNYFPEDIDGSKFYCAGDQEKKKDACQGDSGGPLMASKDSKYYVIGVVSVGGSLCGKNLPTLFTRVDLFSNWIKQTINS